MTSLFKEKEKLQANLIAILNDLKEQKKIITKLETEAIIPKVVNNKV